MHHERLTAHSSKAQIWSSSRREDKLSDTFDDYLQKVREDRVYIQGKIGTLSQHCNLKETIINYKLLQN